MTKENYKPRHSRNSRGDNTTLTELKSKQTISFEEYLDFLDAYWSIYEMKYREPNLAAHRKNRL